MEVCIPLLYDHELTITKCEEPLIVDTAVCNALLQYVYVCSLFFLSHFAFEKETLLGWKREAINIYILHLMLVLSITPSRRFKPCHHHLAWKWDSSSSLGWLVLSILLPVGL